MTQQGIQSHEDVLTPFPETPAGYLKTEESLPVDCIMYSRRLVFCKVCSR
jgi:hypothetical protein